MDGAEEAAVGVLRAKGRSFYFASRLLSARHRSRAARLYAFCRHVDDLADEADDAHEAERRLAALDARLSLREPPLATQSADPKVEDLLRLAAEADLSLEPLRCLVAGVRSDLILRQIEDERALLRYAYQVAGTVGVLMCDVLNVEDPAALPFAIDLGIAMQLTNIARDVGEDAALGRVYLPKSWIGPCTPEQILQPSLQAQECLREAVKRLLALADGYYESGLAGLVYVPSAARHGILVAAAVYREIGQVLAASGHQSWRDRAVVSQPRRLARAAAALTAYWLSSIRQRPRPVHRRSLHLQLDGCYGAHPS